MRVLAFALGACAWPCATADAQQAPLRAGEWVHETAAAFPGAEPTDDPENPHAWCVRIVDAVDRRPIAGALVQVPWHPSRGYPIEELHYQCAARADWDGWVRLPWDAVAGYRDYVFADAPGYAANEDCIPGEVECLLQRGVDVPVQVVDYTGRPVSDAGIELVLGCGHVPSQRRAVTDANGLAVLRDVQPSRTEDIFVTHPSCQFGAYELRRIWDDGRDPVVIDVVPGVAMEGRVVDARRQPVPGVLVGAREKTRPWSRTGRDGSFRLVGLAAWATIAVEAPAQLGFDRIEFPAPPAGVSRTVILGELERENTVDITVRDEHAAPAPEVRVALIRNSDGFTATAETDEAGRLRLLAPAGRYRLLADGELGVFGRNSMELEIREGKAASPVIVVPRNPTVRVDASKVIGFTVGITTATQFRQLDPEAIDGEDVPVPAGERATFRISLRHEGELIVRHVEVPAPGADILLEPLATTRLKGQCIGPDGHPSAAQLHVSSGMRAWVLAPGSAPESSTPDVMADTYLTGKVTWVAVPRDETLAPAHGETVLPPTGGEVDLGKIQFTHENRPNLRLILPLNLQGEGGTVVATLMGGRGRFENSLDEQDSIDVGLSGVTAGDWLRISLGDEVLPLQFRAPGPPPWQIAWPKARLQLTVRSAKNLPIADAVVIVDGTILRHRFDGVDRTEIRYLQAGAHSIVVAQKDHLARVYRLVIEDGETRELEVLLSPRED